MIHNYQNPSTSTLNDSLKQRMVLHGSSDYLNLRFVDCTCPLFNLQICSQKVLHLQEEDHLSIKGLKKLYVTPDQLTMSR